jgi:DNA-binding transcriptional MerR regulator
LEDKAPDAFRTISEVADDLDLPQHVLRFWESRFREIKPMKRGGGRRYYRPDDVHLLRGIRHLLYGEGYTIRGVQRILREQGSNFVEAVWREGAPQPPHGAREDEDVNEAVPVESFEQKRGLLGRLIGRDLSDPSDDAPERPEPPLDRPLMARKEAVQHHVAPIVQVAPSRPATPGQLTRDDIGKLHGALHELAECRRLIDAVLARPD